MRTRLRFYADLADLAGTAEIEVPVGNPRSVKDLIESCGVPHPEVAIVVVDGQAVGFDHQIAGGERIAVYPPFADIDLGDVTTVAPAPVAPRFVLDVHLGALARRLRLLGFDVWYTTSADDGELTAVAAGEQRILLTRDRELLMRRVITHGYCPRSDDPDEQALEVVRRYGLSSRLAPLSRCVRCNGELRPVAKGAVADQLPPRTRAAFDTFTRCRDCGQIYWPGSHRDALKAFLARATAGRQPSDPGSRE